MGLFHEEDDVSPSEMPFSDDDAGIGLRAGGANLNAKMAAKNTFGGEAANAVTAADEEEFQELGLRLAG